MNPDEFKASPASRLVPAIQNCWAFVPNRLPPALNLEPLIPQLARASQVLGELSGIGRTMVNPYLLARPFLRKEAVASSRIEGTVTSFGQLLLFEAGADERSTAPDAREVHNYVRALEHALRRLDELPVCLRLMNEMHAILVDGVNQDRGAKIAPGEFRRDQNWIGARLIQNARFVPPPPNEVLPALDAFEKYIQASSDTPLLIRVALIHYQFEAIHPYPDGNGRVGRLLIPLVLFEQRAMPRPLLYLSNYFEKHKDRYIDLLLEVSRSGAWNPWIEFFLRGIEEECRDAIAKVVALQNLQAEYHQRIQKARSSVLLTKLVDLLFESPVITVPKAAERLKISYNAAKNNFARLMSAKIIEPVDIGIRPKFWMASEIFDVMQEDRAGASTRR